MKKEIPADKKIKFENLIIDNIKYKTTLTQKYINRKPYHEIVPGIMTAFIPGTITEVFVKEGQKVAEGDPLVVLEAMKMLNEIKAPFDGEVKQLAVVSGQRVSKNQLLVEVVSS
ncbi:MAG: acetyl-CoA carboxylase biotin carboxyl carrier protein subunit [Bacteroidetes bacterium]|jgi:biotin carboxyl carrier protein|nr:acetyl-CoA carboxylase biotin carboxyl carrier protein subunit [Bacteroidota bacterium]MBU1579061.1 acetyl-CoA carboxylase biotin carboxyl carrier protein subunit [Bacteroidota bacterium]MBU2557650.1 acetyl-CoA carboxylase biotin carboxyl carrier protein subunit [Bacteroidota bacterium]MDA3944388.1 acetyl-CoA carboxylase biotin carboxyl carrier protein subunit [Bacteroidota bacterium]